MSPTLKELGIDRLSSEERLRLIEDIWETLTPIHQLEIPEAHREELDRRLAAADASRRNRSARSWRPSSWCPPSWAAEMSLMAAGRASSRWDAL